MNVKLMEHKRVWLVQYGECIYAAADKETAIAIKTAWASFMEMSQLNRISVFSERICTEVPLALQPFTAERGEK